MNAVSSAQTLDFLLALPDLSNLHLAASMPDLDDAAVARLARTDRLVEFSLSAPPLTDASLTALGQCATLESLRLCSKRFTDAGVAALAGARRLRTLELWDVNLTDPALVALGELTDLTSLELRNLGPVTPRGLGALAGLPRLTRLTVYARHLSVSRGCAPPPRTC